MKIKLTFWRVVFIVIMALGLYSSFIRYFRGLGAVSNMTDQFPWGLWIGFDCLCGVMLAAGGFCMVGAVYLFNVERLHSVVRPAVLTAFLGYILFIVGLLFDLGRPWYIWHQLIYMNPHSVMFEVGHVRDVLHHGALLRIPSQRIRALQSGRLRSSGLRRSTRC